jgi:putative transposase
VSREADRWFVSFAVEREREKGIPEEDTAVGVDVGLCCFAVTSEAARMHAPRPLERSLKLLKRRSRQHARKKRGSKNRRKSAMCLARLHRKIRNRRRDFLHETSTRLAKTKRVIGVEDLNVKGMIRNRHLGRHIADSGWGELMRMLEYKTNWYGSVLVKAPRFFPSTKTCCACGRVKHEMKLSERVFRCESCGLVIDRDLNAAMNLAEYARTASSAGSCSCEDTIVYGDPRDRDSAGRVSMKQEAECARLSYGINVHTL